MKVCSNCFDEEEIKQFINSSSIGINTCDCCESKQNVIDLEDLYDFFKEFTALYIPDIDSLTTLAERLQSDWKIFTSEKHAYSILKFLFDQNIINHALNYMTKIEKYRIWASS